MRWFLWFTLAAFLFLSACSDSSSANDSEQVATDGVYPTEDDLPNCTSKLEGDSAYVEEDDAFYVCSGKSWNLVASSIEEDSEAVATSIEGVNGYMQKGPFLSGSKVRVLELESGRTLRQTGRNFETVIQTDDGKFALNAQTMVSQYIELHAEGFYRNEVTGTESEAPISLYAITDVSKRDHGLVNINLLTHLEYQRVVYLVKEKKMKVAAAKDSAQKEVLAMLGITNNKGFGSSEDLNVVGSTDADGALLAFSVLFQGNRTEAQLTSLLQGVVSDLKEDGKWDDEETKTKIADWAEAQDLGGRLTTIRGHVADWKLGSVPNFEKYVRNFWYTNYGLGECTTSDKWKIVKNKNTKSENKDVYFICEDNAWRVVSDIERDTYDYENNRPWSAGELWESRAGSITGTLYEYDGSKWRISERSRFLVDEFCFSGDLWSGCDNEQDKVGYWQDFNDNPAGGKSDIGWPTQKSDVETVAMKPIIDYCGGICGEVNLLQGVENYSFAGITFDVVNNDGMAVDASSWEGICVAYSLDEGMDLQLSQGSAIDYLYRGGYPSVSLQAAIDTVVNFAWSDFKMPSWVYEYQSVNGEVAAKQLVAIQFQLLKVDDTFYRSHFNIKAIGRKGTCQAQP